MFYWAHSGKTDGDSEEEGPMQRELDYTIDYRDYTWTKLLGDLQKSVCWGDAQKIRATLRKQLKVGPSKYLVVATLGGGDIELYVEVAGKVHVCHAITSICTH